MMPAHSPLSLRENAPFCPLSFRERVGVKESGSRLSHDPHPSPLPEAQGVKPPHIKRILSSTPRP
jgi:hypothetical protein